MGVRRAGGTLMATAACRPVPRVARAPAVPSQVLGMGIFLLTEVMLFGGLVSAYLVLRGQAAVWPPPGQPRLPVAVTAVNTLLLAASAWPAWRVVPALVAGHGPARRRLIAALTLGLAFLAIQGSEWARLVSYGLTGASSLYGGMFYVIVGAHAAHVAAAAVALTWGIHAAGRGRLGPDGARALRLYWIFVVSVWPPLYALVYLW